MTDTASYSHCLIRVVDDDINVLRSWSFVLEGEGWRVKTFNSAAAFLAQDEPFIPGCLVLDVRMPEMSGLELQHEMKSKNNPLPIIFFSGHGDIDMAVRSIKDGAFDFLSKPVETTRLLDVITRAVDFDIERRAKASEIARARTAFSQLSTREQEVAKGVAEGLLNKQIAFNLNITEKTVIAHRSSLCKKLGIRTAADITRLLLTLEHSEQS